MTISLKPNNQKVVIALWPVSDAAGHLCGACNRTWKVQCATRFQVRPKTLKKDPIARRLRASLILVIVLRNFEVVVAEVIRHDVR
jgi:hypothetical protein